MYCCTWQLCVPTPADPGRCICNAAYGVALEACLDCTGPLGGPAEINAAKAAISGECSDHCLQLDMIILCREPTDPLHFRHQFSMQLTRDALRSPSIVFSIRPNLCRCLHHLWHSYRSTNLPTIPKLCDRNFPNNVDSSQCIFPYTNVYTVIRPGTNRKL